MIFDAGASWAPLFSTSTSYTSSTLPLLPIRRSDRDRRKAPIKVSSAPKTSTSRAPRLFANFTTSPPLPSPAILASYTAETSARHLFASSPYPRALSPTSSTPPSPSEDSLELKLASRRRGGGGGRGDYDSLPMHVQPDLFMLGSAGRPRGARCSGPSLCHRPRFVGSLVLVALVTLVLLPASNRSAAHSALTKAGVPLPAALPDRLHDFIDYWNWGDDDGANDLEYIPPPEPILDSPEDEPELESPHLFHPNGYLIVEAVSTFAEPPAPHPILTLIKRAEAQWNRKVARQSKTLKEAVVEYRRRYRKNPPKGFDKWWAYAKANRVVLTDEYDQIHHDLEPFWALYVGLRSSYLRWGDVGTTGS
jgi:hypothetical protein